MDGVVSETGHFADGKLILTRTGGIAAIAFNNPDKLNAMTMSMWQALGEVCETLAADESLRCLTLTGAGDRAFVVGADISEFCEKRSDAAVSAAYNDAVARAETAIEAMPVPTLALIRGYCIGGGLGIAMRCDLRLARDDAQFAVTPARLGLGYGYDSVASLADRLGHATTADLLFSGRKMDATEALAKDLCNQVFPAASYDTDCAAYIAQIDLNAPLTIRTVKSALRDLARPEASRNRSATDALAKTCFDSADYQEGQRAFAEKRQPMFRGQ